MKTLVKKIFNKFLPATQVNRISYQEALTELINSRIPKKTSTIPAGEGTSIIIFSKDRAIQLHALLGSCFDLVTGAGPIHILFTSSTAGHMASYKEVENLFKDKSVTFHQESNFRKDLVNILDAINTEKLFFLVDDIVFTEAIDLADLNGIDTEIYVPTLRLGQNLTFAYTVQQQQSLPKFEQLVRKQNFIIWRWENGTLDWNYPLSVDGHLFDTKEISILIKHAYFKAPNSLEHSLQQYNPIFLKRYGLAYHKSVLVNIPNNKVQTENSNIAGNVSIDSLLQKWQAGYQIDFKKLRHFVNNSAHQEIAIEFIPRTVS